MADFHRASLEMAWLCLCRVTNESTEMENCYSSLKRELRWLWKSVYVQDTRHTLCICSGRRFLCSFKFNFNVC